ncbi:MAG: hypothetical protein LBE79_09570, partial [Tannerella sp.]|nr:hypothetical protein [Tannerella sp.]MDR0796278.1 hypothetical protein [Tannerella sp.]
MRIKASLVTLCILALSPLGFTLSGQTLQDAILYTESEQFGNANQAYQSLISQQPGNGTNYFY